MTSNRRHQEGVALVAFAIAFLALAAAATVAIDLAHLAYTATAIQTAADAGATAGVIALAKGENCHDQAMDVANHSLAPSIYGDVGTPAWTLSGDDAVKIGNYSVDSNGVGVFNADVIPYNAVKVSATITVTNLLAGSVFDSVFRTTDVTRESTATFQTIGAARPGIPIALGKCGQCDPGSCSSTQITLSFNGLNNAAWITSDQNSGVTGITAYVPTGCGGGGQRIPQLSAASGSTPGSMPSLDNGVKKASKLCPSFKCLEGREYLVPIVGNDCSKPYNGQEVIGFETIEILKVNCGNDTMTVRTILNDCKRSITCACPEGVTCDAGANYAYACSSDSDCTGLTTCTGNPCGASPCGIFASNSCYSFGGTCPSCGTGSVALVQ
jgi:Flp pilus assembly protein TadG